MRPRNLRRDLRDTRHALDAREADSTASRLLPRWDPNAEPRVTTKPLGVSYERDAVHVRMYAWRNRRVDLVLESTGETIPMVPDDGGVFEARIARSPAQIFGQRYHFVVDGHPVSDPEADGSGGPANDYLSSVFVDLNAHQWRDRGFRRPKPSQMIISEVNLRDLTMHPSADVPEELRGTFLGAAHPSIIQHFKDLGVNAIEPLPVHEFAEQDAEPVGGRAPWNHWGYMSRRFRALSGRYASRPENAVAEMQEMVDRYHEAGIAVGMDVVFNHTAGGPAIAFHVLDKAYYYRLTPDGHYYNGTGTGNELNTNSPMVRQMIIRSLRHARDHLHIDFFRFDLAAILDPETMRQIAHEFPDMFLTGEPWAADWNRAQWQKGDLTQTSHAPTSLAGTHWSVWDDGPREAYKEAMLGFRDRHDYNRRNRLKTAIAGNAGYFGDFARPSQSTKYVGSHDGHAIADLFGGDESRVLQSIVMVVTSQGPRMLQQGVEVMASKHGLDNPYNVDRENWVDWSGKQTRPGVFRGASRANHLVRTLPQFHYDRPLTEQDVQWIEPENANHLGMVLPWPRDRARTRDARDVVVLHNTDANEWGTFRLPPGGPWQVAMGEIGVGGEGHRSAEGSYALRPGASVILTRAAAR